MAGLPSPHDVVFKRFLGNLDIARRFLAIHLPTHLKPLCDLSTLQIESSSFIEEDLRQHYADMVYSVKIGERTGYAYLLIEHARRAKSPKGNEALASRRFLPSVST
jgi:predicted transposase/invertase (TIGR01784 family)